MSAKLGYPLETLPTIFQEHFFRVPDYQRGYSWDREQVIDLLEDLENLDMAADGNQHFTGSLVVTWNDEAGRYDIVDGQQRMTTFVILMSCLRQRLDDENRRAELAERYLSRGGKGNEQPVLQLAKNAQSYFENAVIELETASVNKQTFKTHDRIERAKEAINSWLKEREPQSPDLAERLVDIAENRLGLLVYNPETDSEVGIMFEVINNRGKALSTLEKVKNYLIYVATKLDASGLRNRINREWETVLSHLHAAGKVTIQEESGFLRAVAIVFFGLNKKQSSDIYGELRQRFLGLEDVLKDEASRDRTIDMIERFVRFMAQSAYWYQALFYRRDLGDIHPSLDHVLDRIKAQDQYANILPLYLALMVSNNTEGESNLFRLLKLLEVFNFRVYIAPNSRYSNWLQGPLYRLSANYFHGTDLWDMDPDDPYSGDLDRQLERELVRLAIFETGATDEALASRLQLPEQGNYDFFQWGGLKYFLMCYEAYLNPNRTIKVDEILNKREKRATGDYFSIEHIWATEHQKDHYDQPIDTFQKRRLGNFMLLELNLNISGSNRDVREKIELYRDGLKDENGALRVQPTRLAQVYEVIHIYDQAIKKIDPGNFDDGRRKPFRDLHSDIGAAREKRFLKFMEQEWSMRDFDGFNEFNGKAQQTLEF